MTGDETGKEADWSKPDLTPVKLETRYLNQVAVVSGYIWMLFYGRILFRPLLKASY